MASTISQNYLRFLRGGSFCISFVHFSTHKAQVMLGLGEGLQYSIYFFTLYELIAT